MVRAAPGVDGIGVMRREIAALDEKLTAFNGRSLPQSIEQWAFMVRVASSIYVAIGMIGLVLAAVGLAGVTAYSVSRRRREIGIRVALGAQRRDVLGLVMKEGTALVMLGTAIGFAVAWGGLRVMAGIFAEMERIGVRPSNPVLVVGAPLLLAALALGGCYVPARRSLKIETVVALRQE